MTIAFDAKRAFHNSTGLGNYSRTLIRGLATYYPGHRYLLLNPKPSRHYPKPGFASVEELLPAGFIDRRLPSLWRSRRVVAQLPGWGVDLYHGLSHEVPVGIAARGIPSVVTMHDLIFERYPQQFKALDRLIYRRKFRYACAHATRIIAISEQTRRDLVDFYGTDPARIDVCYQSCDPAFGQVQPEALKGELRARYGLPEKFLLYVGSVIERKNLMGVVKALHDLRNDFVPPLVVVGNGGSYLRQVQAWLQEHHMTDKVLFLSLHPEGRTDPTLRRPEGLAALYQMAELMLYPSFFEGFGIPVLEALWSGTPVITSSVSCLPETGGDGALYVDPSRPEAIAEGIRTLLHDPVLRRAQVERGHAHAQNFTLERCTRSVMDVYERVWK